MEGRVQMVVFAVVFATGVTLGFPSYQEFEGAAGEDVACAGFVDVT